VTVGAASTADCKPPATDTGGAYFPDSWQFATYKDAASMREAYNALRTEHDIGQDFGRCSGIEWGGEGSWAHGPDKPGGRRFCYFEGNVAVMVWTHEKLGQDTHVDMLGIAKSGGSDHSRLFNWYRFWVHRIGKCSAPNCVASV
jgi:hypothetical protein